MKGERNCCIVTGLLVSEERNADNPDIKRPILDFEISYQTEKGAFGFTKIPVLFSEVPLARSITKYRIGEIYLIEGVLQNCGGELVIRAKSLAPLSAPKKTPPSLEIGRADLIQMKFVPNVIYLAGCVEKAGPEGFWVKTYRESLASGDLETKDCFFIQTNEPVFIGERVSCLGYLKENKIISRSVLRIMEKEPIS